MKKLNVLKIIDQWGWAYDWIAQEQKRYSKHNIMYERIWDIMDKIDNMDIDIVYLPCPDINKHIPLKLIKYCKNKNIKVIGGYAAETDKKYKGVDLILTISPQTYTIAQDLYQDTIPTVFLPESVDTKYFKNNFKFKSFKVGWAGSFKRPLKRTYLLKKLNYDVKIQCDRNFYQNKTQQHMLNFYNSITALVLTSKTECMPRVVLEAMSASLPVISTDVGSIRMLIGDEWIVPVNPEETLIKNMNEKIKLLEKYPRLKYDVGKRNRQRILKYLSWERNQKLWDKLFTKLFENDWKAIEIINKKSINIFNNFIELQKNPFIKSSILNPSKGVIIEAPVIDEIINKLPDEIIKHSMEKNIPNITKINAEPLLLIPEIKQYTIEEILKLLNKFNYWLLEDSCLNCIQEKKLLSNTLVIGVSNQKIKKQISTFLIKEHGFILKGNKLCNNCHIIIKVSKIQKTKLMLMNKCSVKVPLPVIPYLERLYGNQINKILTNKG